MQVNNVRNPSERNKLILAGVLVIVALVFLWWTFVGFGGSSKPPSARNASQPTSSPASRSITSRNAPPPAVEPPAPADLNELRVLPVGLPTISASEASRNIFVYYEPPKPTPAPSFIPTPTPTPVPPVLLAGLSPATVYAKTGEFKLEVSGDKFTPSLRVLFENSELPTRYISPQQLSATVPPGLIANPGVRQVMLRSADGKLYSNTVSMSLASPPVPNYSYIGILGTPKYVDTAILQDKGNKEVLNVQRGDVLGGRFRVTSISEKEVVLVDNTLKIKHALAMSTQGERGNPLQRPTPKVDSEDDEP
jgi:hypothetical protein